MRLEPRWPNVFIVDLQRIMPENISLQKPIENLRVWSLSVEEIFKKNKLLTIYYPNMNFFKDFSFRRKQMSGGSDFLLACRGHETTHRRFFDQKIPSLRVWGNLMKGSDTTVPWKKINSGWYEAFGTVKSLLRAVSYLIHNMGCIENCGTTLKGASKGPFFTIK